MKEQWIRTAMLLGEEGIHQLSQKRVAVFGIGGVGGHVVEALARSGIGALDLIDNDVVSPSNLNRQIIALWDTIGRQKTQVMQERIEAINPQCQVTTYNCFYLPQQREQFPFEQYDYIVDAIDTVTAKIDLAVTAQEQGIEIISSMGTGNKLDPSQLEVADIYQTSVCPLAKVMRKELKARGIKKLKVVYSKEAARKPFSVCTELADSEKHSLNSYPYGTGKRAIPGSTAFVPAAAGLLIASVVVRSLSGIEDA